VSSLALGARAIPAIVCAVALLASRASPAADVELRTSGQVMRVATVGGLPVQWLTCASVCSDAASERRAVVGNTDGAMEWVADEPSVADAMARVVYAVQVTRTADTVTALLIAEDSPGGRRWVQRYELSQTTHSLRLVLQAPPGVRLRMSTGAGFVPDQMPGFGAAFSDVDVVHVTGSGQQSFAGGQAEIGGLAVDRTAWLGIRSRFWAWLAQPSRDVAAVLRTPAANEPAVEWQVPAGELQLTFYAGPVEWKELRVVSPVLSELLFSALWEPLRWLSFALYFLLAIIMGAVRNAGLAIVLLSLAVKLLLFPLTQIADAWQRDVNRIKSRLQPQIAAIKREFRGEEAHQRTLQVYREEGVHLLYPMKSLAGFAIQLPMFIAAFDMLADNFALSGASFLWIDDLSAPDRLTALPVTLPFFGGYLNLLPVLMTLITVVSARLQGDESLTPILLRRQRRELYAMAAGFFLLFYTFPAGMVLYWTANNAWHFLKVQAGRLLR
jgi:YidC/Oxa1 family membrane protein insertase